MHTRLLLNVTRPGDIGSIMDESPLSPIMIPNICGKPEIYSMPAHPLSKVPTTRDRLCNMPSVIYPSVRSHVLNRPGVAGLPRA